MDGPAEPVLRECRARIDRDAPADQHESFLAVTQFFGRMTQPRELLEEIFTKEVPMIDSPALLDWEAKITQRTLLRVLASRFHAVPDDIRLELAKVYNLESLEQLTDVAGSCPDLATFKARMVTLPKEPPPEFDGSEPQP